MRKVWSFLRSTILVLLLLPVVMVSGNLAMDAVTYALRDYCAQIDDDAYLCVRVVTSPIDRYVVRQ